MYNVNAKTGAIETDESGLEGFLQQCVLFDLNDSVVAILDSNAEPLYENKAYQKFKMVFTIKEQFPAITDEAFIIETLRESIQKTIANEESNTFSAHCYISPAIDVQVTIQLRPVRDAMDGSITAFMLTLLDESIRYDK
jgi:hypothetical protein